MVPVCALWCCLRWQLIFKTQSSKYVCLLRGSWTNVGLHLSRLITSTWCATSNLMLPRELFPTSITFEFSGFTRSPFLLASWQNVSMAYCTVTELSIGVAMSPAKKLPTASMEYRIGLHYSLFSLRNPARYWRAGARGYITASHLSWSQNNFYAPYGIELQLWRTDARYYRSQKGRQQRGLPWIQGLCSVTTLPTGELTLMLVSER